MNFEEIMARIILTLMIAPWIIIYGRWMVKKLYDPKHKVFLFRKQKTEE
mgnify:CR=1 FL=1